MGNFFSTVVGVFVGNIFYFWATHKAREALERHIYDYEYGSNFEDDPFF